MTVNESTQSPSLSLLLPLVPTKVNISKSRRSMHTSVQTCCQREKKKNLRPIFLPLLHFWTVKESDEVSVRAEGKPVFWM